jgi:hypothetical protein
MQNEQLLKEHTQPILRGSRLSQQNIQVVIIKPLVQRFRGGRPAHFRQWWSAPTRDLIRSPRLAHETGHIVGGTPRDCEQLANASTQPYSP